MAADHAGQIVRYAGLAAGAVLGILFAPEKGSTTRQQISDKGEDIFESVKIENEK